MTRSIAGDIGDTFVQRARFLCERTLQRRYDCLSHGKAFAGRKLLCQVGGAVVANMQGH
jgi:hypothetical protein